MKNNGMPYRRMAAGLTAIAAVLALAGGKNMTVQAAESSVIETVSVTFKASFGEPEEIPEPEITVSARGFGLRLR